MVYSRKKRRRRRKKKGGTGNDELTASQRADTSAPADSSRPTEGPLKSRESSARLSRIAAFRNFVSSSGKRGRASFENLVLSFIVQQKPFCLESRFRSSFFFFYYAGVNLFIRMQALLDWTIWKHAKSHNLWSSVTAPFNYQWPAKKNI